MEIVWNEKREMKNTPLQVVVEFQNKLVHNLLKLCCFILKRNVISSCSRQETPPEKPPQHRKEPKKKEHFFSAYGFTEADIANMAESQYAKEHLLTLLEKGWEWDTLCWPSNLNPISECFVKSGFHHGRKTTILSIYIYMYYVYLIIFIYV